MRVSSSSSMASDILWSLPLNLCIFISMVHLLHCFRAAGVLLHSAAVRALLLSVAQADTLVQAPDWTGCQASNGRPRHLFPSRESNPQADFRADESSARGHSSDTNSSDRHRRG